MWGPVFTHQGTDGSPSPGNIPFLSPQSPPLKWWELKGPRRKCKVRFAHLEKPTGWEDPECFPRVWSCLELCPSASPDPAQPPDHPLQAQLNSPLTINPLKSSLQTLLMMIYHALLLGTQGTTHHHPLFRALVFKESCSQLMVFQFSQGFLPHRALSPNVLFFPYPLYSPQFLLCFTFSLTFFRVLKLEAKWAFMSSEGELRAGAYYRANPKHPGLKIL